MAYKEGLNTVTPVHFETAIDYGSLRVMLEKKLDIMLPEGEKAQKYKQPWAFFSVDGVRLTRLSALVSQPVVYIMEGGQFVWPGIRVGHKRVVKNLHALGDINMETLAMTPLVFSVEEFLKDSEIDVILDLSLEHLAPSGVVYVDGDEGKPATEWRTSTQYFLPSKGNPVLQGKE
jgi:prolyl 4-hydroxylase